MSIWASFFLAEVLGRYSNPSPTGARLAKARTVAEQDRRSEPWQTPELGEIARVRRAMASGLEAMVAEYQAGVGCVELGRRYGISPNTVLVYLRSAGVEIRTQGKLSPDDVEELYRLHEAGWSYAAIGRELGVSRVAVSLRLKR